MLSLEVLLCIFAVLGNVAAESNDSSVPAPWPLWNETVGPIPFEISQEKLKKPWETIKAIRCGDDSFDVEDLDGKSIILFAPSKKYYYQNRRKGYCGITLSSAATKRFTVKCMDNMSIRWHDSFKINDKLFSRTNKDLKNGVEEISNKINFKFNFRRYMCSYFFVCFISYENPTTTISTTTTTTTTSTTTTTTTTSKPDNGSKCSCGKANTNKTRVVGGVDSETNEFPWQISLMKAYGSRLYFICGGSIVSKKHVVTAAHCISNPDRATLFRVGVGLHRKNRMCGKNVKQVSKITNHPQWNRKTIDYDISIMELKDDLNFADVKIGPICLPNINEDHAGNSATISGWGRTRAGGATATNLQKAQLRVWTQKECSVPWSRYLTDRMVCAGGDGKISGCQGDSGGPLTNEEKGHHELVGVTSWGPSNCNVKNYPSVFARVANTELHKWVLENTFGTEQC